MVGKTKLGRPPHNWVSRLKRSISHDSTEPVRPLRPSKRHVPLIASPLDPKATEWLTRKHASGNLTLRRRPTIAQFEAERIAGGIFRKQHEATTLELFFDLFFVANLAVFTANHQHTSAGSLGNYVGFFTILWFTWFHNSIFDVRFYVDSLFNRFCKLISFGVFTAFTGLGPLYEVIINGGTSRAFHGIALVLMMSRLVLLLQHATVLWFVRDFKKTVLPLALMMLVYLTSAMGFLATYVEDSQKPSIDENAGLRHLIVWYCIIGAEALLVIIISSVWRILSFKHTHLVERIGLLTLIIMGEGIIGLTKSVSYMLSATNISVWSIFGKVVAAVMLIYEIYLLYFSPIDHDRFGTIRQQVWTLLHFPMHVSILLTEEGSAVALLWDSVQDARRWFKKALPPFVNPGEGFNNTAQFVQNINNTMKDTEVKFHYAKLKDYYKWDDDLKAISNISAKYASTEWNAEVTPILNGIYVQTSNFFFENFNFEAPKQLAYVTDPDQKLAISESAFQTTFVFFYAAAGALLLALASMYWIGKRNKTKEEWAAIVVRIVVGLAIPCTIIAAYVGPRESSLMFRQSGWIIPIVSFAFLFVVLVDNHINSWVDKKLDNYDEDPEDGTRAEKHHSESRDHRYGALHGQHADAQAAALHFGKPASFHHGSHGSHGESSHAEPEWANPSHSRTQSRNPSRRPSVTFNDRPHPRTRDLDAEDGENTPFVTAAESNSHHARSGSMGNGPSSATPPQLPMPTPLSEISTSYTPYGDGPAYPRAAPEIGTAHTLPYGSHIEPHPRSPPTGHHWHPHPHQSGRGGYGEA